MDVQSLLMRLLGAKRSGSGWIAKCPAHEDSSPSLSIAEGRARNVLLKCHAGCSFEAITGALGIEPVELAGEDNNIMAPAKRERLTLVATYSYPNADGTPHSRKLRYTDSYGAKTFRWERPDPKNPQRWIPGGNDAPLYRLPELIGAAPEEIAVIVEGEKDADRLASLGFIATTTPNGASAKWRESDTPYFAGRKVCVIADDDDAGRTKAKNTAAALKDTAAAVGIVTLPNPAGIKGFDASDFLNSGGTAAQLCAIVEAFDAPRLPAEVASPEVIEKRVVDLWQRGGPEPGIYPGWSSIAQHWRPKLAQIAIITGSPNAGKSTWMDDVVIRTSVADDEPGTEDCARWKWIIFSPEQYPVERHVSMLLQKFLAKPFGEGPTARMTENEVRYSLRTLCEYVTILDPKFANAHLDRILEVAAELNAQQKRHALLIDPFNVIAATSRSKGESEHDFINTFLAKLRAFATAEDMFVACVAHPTKLKREDGAEEYPVVRPWDISGSAHWYNHSDSIVSVWRALKDEERDASGEVEIHISKVRFQPECGTLGMTKLYFDRVTGRYLESPRSNFAQQQRSSRPVLAPWEAEA